MQSANDEHATMSRACCLTRKKLLGDVITLANVEPRFVSC